MAKKYDATPKFEPEPKTRGWYLRRARKAKELTQGEVCSQIDELAQSQYSKMELNKFSAQDKTLKALSVLLDIPLNHLFDIDIEPPPRTKAGNLDNPKTIAKDSTLPEGLREFAANKSLIRAHNIEDKEWQWLATMQLPTPINADGYLSLLINQRAASNYR